MASKVLQPEAEAQTVTPTFSGTIGQPTGRGANPRSADTPVSWHPRLQPRTCAGSMLHYSAIGVHSKTGIRLARPPGAKVAKVGITQRHAVSSCPTPRVLHSCCSL